MNNILNSGFSDKTSINRVLKFTMGLNIDGKDLYELLHIIALEFLKRDNRKTATNTQLKSWSLSDQFSHVVDRLIKFYDPDEERCKIAKEYYNSLVAELKEKEKQLSLVKSNPAPNNNQVIFKLILDDKSVWQKGEITLYEYKDASVNIDSKAYFEKEDLVIDYWILSERYEDEYLLTVKKEQLIKLCHKCEPNIKSKSELWQFLLDNFKGENAFWDVKKYLELKGISFDNGVRHG